MATSGEPDWDKLRAIGDEITRLEDQGMFTESEFDRLYPLALEAANGGFDILGFIEDRAEWSWFKKHAQEHKAP